MVDYTAKSPASSHLIFIFSIKIISTLWVIRVISTPSPSSIKGAGRGQNNSHTLAIFEPILLQKK